MSIDLRLASAADGTDMHRQFRLALFTHSPTDMPGTMLQAFQDDSTPAAVVKKAPGDPLAKPSPKEAAAEVKPPAEEFAEAGFNAQSLWPVGVVASGGLLFALSKVDPGFWNLLDATVTRVRFAHCLS